MSLISEMAENLKKRGGARRMPDDADPMVPPVVNVGPAEPMAEEPKESGGGMSREVAMGLVSMLPVLIGGIAGGNEGGALGGKVGADTVGKISAKEDDDKKTARTEADLARKEQLADKKTKEGRDFQASQSDKSIKAANDRSLIAQKGADSRADKKSGVEKEPKSTQFAAATYGHRTVQANQDLEDLVKSGYDRTSNTEAFQSAFLPNAAASENTKRQDQAERNFTNAVLRRESGAAISPKEFSSAEQQYFPRAGDPPSVLDQKARNRQTVIAGLKAESGSAWSRVAGELAEMPTPKNTQQGKGGVPGVTEAHAGNDKAELESSNRQKRIQELRAKTQRGSEVR